MAEIAVWTNGTTVPGILLRRMMESVMGPGVARGPIAATTGDLAVTEHTGTPNMSVDVAAGGVWVLGTTLAKQGVYFADHPAQVKTIAAAHGSNARKDIVVARVREDAVDSSGATEADISVVTGTASGSPVAPAVPANCYLLATVDVPAADTAITNSQITSARALAHPWNSAWGTLASVTSTSINQAPAAGADITGVTVTITAVAGRRYRAWYKTSNYDSGGAGTIRHRIKNSGGTVLASATNRSLVASSPDSVTLMTAPITPGAGTYTVKAHGELMLFTTNGFVYGDANDPIELWIEDIGPA